MVLSFDQSSVLYVAVMNSSVSKLSGDFLPKNINHRDIIQLVYMQCKLL